jgi:hypothetical protein
LHLRVYLEQGSAIICPWSYLEANQGLRATPAEQGQSKRHKKDLINDYFKHNILNADLCPHGAKIGIKPNLEWSPLNSHTHNFRNSTMASAYSQSHCNIITSDTEKTQVLKSTSKWATFIKISTAVGRSTHW